MDLVPHLLRGLWMTVQLAAAGLLLAALCAFAGGLGRLSRDPVVRWFSGLYVEIFRGTSALVQLFWFYFALPRLLEIRLDAFVVGVLVLGLNIGAYGAEVVRAAMQAVPAGQHQAAIALGFSRVQRIRWVILPQALPAMLPPFGNLAIELLKTTALVSMIELTDLTRAGVFLRDETHRTGEIFALLLVIYFVLSQVISRGFRWLEARPQWIERGARTG